MAKAKPRGKLAVTQDGNFLSAFAERVREVYCQSVRSWHASRGEDSDYGLRGPGKKGHLPKWDGGEDSWNKVYSSIWPSLAEALLSRGVSPESYFPFHFRSSGSGRMPTPAELKSDRCIDHFKQAETPGRLRDRVRIILNCDKETFESVMQERSGRMRWGWTPEQILISVLGDDILELSALYRYVMAKGVGLTWLANAYQVQAVGQYLEAKEQYDEMLPTPPFEIVTGSADNRITITTGRVLEL